MEAIDERILQSTNTRERKMAVAWLRNSRSALVPNFLAVAREGNPHKLDVTNWTGTFVIVEQIPQLGSIEERVWEHKDKRASGGRRHRGDEQMF